MNEISSTAKSLSHGGTWEFTRIKDGHNGHDFVCNTFTVRHTKGIHSYGGPFWIRIRSSKPLIGIHVTPDNPGCTFDTSGYKTCSGCQQTVFKSTNCPGHFYPSHCRAKKSPGSRYRFLSDTDKNAAGEASQCCVNGKGPC